MFFVIASVAGAAVVVGVVTAAVVISVYGDAVNVVAVVMVV